MDIELSDIRHFLLVIYKKNLLRYARSIATGTNRYVTLGTAWNEGLMRL